MSIKFFTVFCICIGIACTTTNVGVNEVQNLEELLIMQKGDAYKSWATCYPSGSLPLDWTTDNVEVAVVYRGIIVATGPGVTYITAICEGDSSGQIKVNVNPQ